MLGVDLERVTGAELCIKVFMVNNKKWCYQLASVKQSALFCRNHNEHQVKINAQLLIILALQMGRVVK